MGIYEFAISIFFISWAMIFGICIYRSAERETNCSLKKGFSYSNDDCRGESRPVREVGHSRTRAGKSVIVEFRTLTFATCVLVVMYINTLNL